MNIIRRGALVVALILAVAGTASAQFRFGIRAGIQTNSLHFNKSTFDSDNRVGFTGGVMAEFTVPVVGIGADLGLMYTHRSTDLMVATNEGVEEVDGRIHRTRGGYRRRSRTDVHPSLHRSDGGDQRRCGRSGWPNYIEIPLNLKWRINIPLINKIVRPYVFTGPSFAFLTSKKAITDAIKNRSCDVAWNVGAGVELFSHLQVGACYGFGMTKAFDVVGISDSDGIIDARQRCWTITAAYLF